MTTMSGSNRRACSMASATVPASATTWKPSRRSSSATRPCRTTSWSSTMSRRSGLGGRSVRRWSRVSPVVASGSSDDDTGALPGSLSIDERPGRSPPLGRACWPARSGPLPRRRVGIEAGAVVRDLERRVVALDLHDAGSARRAAVAGDVADRLARDLQSSWTASGDSPPPAVVAPARSISRTAAMRRARSRAIDSSASASPPRLPARARR